MNKNPRCLEHTLLPECTCFWGGNNHFLFWIRSGFAWIFFSLRFSFCFHSNVTSACRMKTRSFPHDIRVWGLTSVIPHLEEKVSEELGNNLSETRKNSQSGNSQDKMKKWVRPWLPTTLRGSRVFVRVSRVTGSSEYFCQHTKTSFTGGTGEHSYLLQKLGEQMRGCSFPYLHVSGSHRQQCSRWFCEVRRGNAEETLVYVAFVKRHRGRWVCGTANTMTSIFLAINLSRSAIFGAYTKTTPPVMIELFCNRATAEFMPTNKLHVKEMFTELTGHKPFYFQTSTKQRLCCSLNYNPMQT